MRKFIPPQALVQEAERALEGISKKGLTETDLGKHLTFWMCGDSGVRVSLKNGMHHSDFLELNLRRRLAVFCKGYEDYPTEERQLVEENLRARGYRITERDFVWFNADKDRRKYLDKEVYAAA